MKEKGFTLIELLGVIILLGVVGLIVVPSVTNLIKDSKQKLYNTQVHTINKVAKDWSIENVEQLSETKTICLSLEQLINEGYLEQSEIIDPRNEKNKMNGSITIKYNDSYSKYEYLYSEQTIEECYLNNAITFNINYGGSSNDYFYNIIEVSDGYVTIGYSESTDGDLTGLNKGGRDAIIVKYDLNGNVIWKKNYGGSSEDYFEGIIEVNDGYIVTGRTNSTDGDLAGISKGGGDAIIVKYDKNGNIIWNKTYGGSFTEHFYDIISVNNGYVVVGFSNSTNGDLTGLNKGGSDSIIVKYDLSGNVIWKKNYGGSSTDYFKNIILTSDGYTVVGNSSSTDGDLTGLNKGLNDAIIVKYDLTGNVVWKKNYGGSSEDYFKNIILVSDGYTVVGNSSSTDGDLTGLNKGLSDAVIVKYDLTGNVVWKKNYGGNTGDDFNAVALASDGYVTTGFSNSTNGDLTGLNKGLSDAIIVKYDLTGNIVWKKSFGGSGSEYFYNIESVIDGYALVGFSDSINGDLTGLNKGLSDAVIFKLDINGQKK
ncbi:MAG: prepilin-type N-terminal cleavage/methylation domain-containing protein [Bacilli bacterium]|nr:prepilin-type N-terminal cleavage/methylation domain-containing protein [Bacilli bacterium]MDD4808573.1 prepilin-type N-terminal cleavage/methylation domain-containing protein [Bacilli bacterium]